MSSESLLSPRRVMNQYGTHFAYAYIVFRIINMIVLIPLVALVANYISHHQHDLAKIPISTITIVSVAFFLSIVTFLSFCSRPTDSAHKRLNYLIAADLLLLAAFITISIGMGIPLAPLKCGKYFSDGQIQFYDPYYLDAGSFGDWARTSQDACRRAKAVLGLCVALAALFLCTVCCLGFVRGKVSGVEKG